MMTGGRVRGGLVPLAAALAVATVGAAAADARPATTGLRGVPATRGFPWVSGIPLSGHTLGPRAVAAEARMNPAGRLVRLQAPGIPLRCGRRLVGRVGPAALGGLPVARDGRIRWRRVLANPQTGYWDLQRIAGRATPARDRVTGTYSYEQHLPDGRVCRTGVVRFAASIPAYTGTAGNGTPVGFTMGVPRSVTASVAVLCDGAPGRWRADPAGRVMASMAAATGAGRATGSLSVSTPEGCEGEVTFTALRAYRGDAFGGAADWYLSVPGVIEPPPAPPA